jgi:predicted nucleic acid-binding protein
VLDRLDFAEAYLVAQAESTEVGAILSFDRSVDRVSSVRRQEPGELD